VWGTGQRICRLADEAANAEQPRDALRALNALRRELEDFERQQAARALTAGETFSAVARSLGVSRQAAHRRFRDLAPPAPPDGGERPTPEARLVVEYARREATELGAAAVRSEHVLLGVLRNSDPRVAAALLESGVTLDEARARALELALRSPGQTVDDAREGAAPARLIAHAAVLEARRAQTPIVGIDHLLLAALADDRQGAAEVLRGFGLSPDAVRAMVGAAPGNAAPDRAREAVGPAV
jgi:transposase-like protein